MSFYFNDIPYIGYYHSHLEVNYFMPRTGVTIYDMLISCPGDVLDYINTINEVVRSFNSTIGRVNNLQIDCRHWSTDSYAQSGGRPQELLNSQFVMDCDMAVAVFWSKFGSPTGEYDSGTEEEIEAMLAQNKQVFLYFVDAPMSPSELDEDQYRKIKMFKDKYKDIGIYTEVKSKEEFASSFTNQLSLYTLSNLIGNNQDALSNGNSTLSIREYNNETEDITAINLKSFKDDFYQKYQQEITDLFEDAVKVTLPSATNEIESHNYFSYMKLSNIDIPVDWKDTISKYLNKLNVVIPTGFWNVGNLKYMKTINPFSGGDSLIGTKDEEKHYKDIKELNKLIKEVIDWKDYFEKLKEFKSVELIVANDGSSIDEDIEIKLIIPKDKLLMKNYIPVPGENIIKEYLQAELENKIFKPLINDEIEEYGYYSETIEKPMPMPIHDYPPFSKRHINTFDEDKDDYMERIDNIFCYDFYKRENEDVLKFSVDYLKHNKTMAFPSVLIFKSLPERIDYEITSKYCQNIIKGTLYLS